MKVQLFVISYLAGLLVTVESARSQTFSNNVRYSAEFQTTFAQPQKLPFWFRSGQYGSIPLAGTSAGLIGSAYKAYDTLQRHKLNWSGGVQLRFNQGDRSKADIIEAYLKVKKGIFELSAGRIKEIVGITDSSTLSSGAFSISGNALGIPRVSLGIPDFYHIPIFDNLFSIKAKFGFGYFGNVNIAFPYSRLRKAGQYYNDAELYMTMGRKDWRVSFIGGINHNVMFGHEQEMFGSEYKLSSLQSFIYAIVGKTYRDYNSSLNDRRFGGKVGNHIGSIDGAVKYRFDNVKLLIYHQFIYDVGALAHLENLSDGITGISLTHTASSISKINWRHFLIEFIYTKDQAGGFDSKAPSGDENYYNDVEFTQGWSYYGLNLGNPLLASRQYTRADLITNPSDYIIDNRIVAVNTGVQGSINRVMLTMKLTYSKNYGTYGTSKEGHSTGPEFVKPRYGLFKEVNQFSGYMEASKSFENNFSGGIAVGYDNGGLYYNTLGLQLRVSKAFN